jgi:hypothetical protein
MSYCHFFYQLLPVLVIREKMAVAVKRYPKHNKKKRVKNIIAKAIISFMLILLTIGTDIPHWPSLFKPHDRIILF